MTITPVGIYATGISSVPTGGTAVTLMYGPVLGGFIVNPATALDQGISLVEVLYIDVIGPAATAETATTIALQPGQSYTVPANLTSNVSVNAATSGHRFTAVTFQPLFPAVPGALIGVINPCLQNTIPSYLYQQYANDDDLQAWVAAYNTIAQQYVTWFNTINLPVYTGPLITGDLLDWVALGLYGVARPVLGSGSANVVGQFNTYTPNFLTFNGEHTDRSSEVFTPVDDDIFKRILTWKLYKGDSKQMSIRWLKRRILRFLLGTDGTDVNTADTQQISITFSDDSTVTLTVIVDNLVNIADGTLINTFAFNTDGFNLGSPVIQDIKEIETFTHGNQINITISQTPTALPNTAIFKKAVDNGVLDMPFQFVTVVTLI